MNLFYLCAVLLLTVLSNNLVFCRLLGVESLVDGGKDLKTAGTMGGVVGLGVALACLCFWPVDNWVLVPLDLTYLRTVFCVLLSTLITRLLLKCLRGLAPKAAAHVKGHNALVMFNSGVLGAALLSGREAGSFGGAVLWGLCAGAGFLLAILLYTGVGIRLEFSSCPRAFRGFPIALITLGLLSLAFSGFAGIHL